MEDKLFELDEVNDRLELAGKTLFKACNGVSPADALFSCKLKQRNASSSWLYPFNGE